MDNSLIPEFLFSIRNLVVKKIPNSKEKFAYVLSYVQELKTSKKYNITVKDQLVTGKSTEIFSQLSK